MEKILQIFEFSTIPTRDEARKKYKKLCLKWHPDKNEGNLDFANIKFKELQDAYENLTKYLDQIDKSKSNKRKRDDDDDIPEKFNDPLVDKQTNTTMNLNATISIFMV